MWLLVFPLLGVPSLADAPAEAIDGRTLRYRLKANLARKKNEEEEEKKRQEESAKLRRRAQALLDHAASLPKRKRKKKRKKRLPKSSARHPPPSGIRTGKSGIILRALHSGSLLFSVLVLLGSTVDTVLVSVLRGFGFLPYFLRVGLGS